MPFAIDEEKFRKQATFDVSAPPNSATGIPVKQIPFLEYPRCLYKHPNEPFRTIIHRNAQHEIVEQEIVQTEHISKIVNSEEEMKAVLADGWVKEAYIPKDLPKVEDGLYTPKAAKK